MRKFLPVIAIAAALVFGQANAQALSDADKAARAETKMVNAQKIILVGDSTVQSNSGWGGAFCATHLAHSVACINLARGGRSSFSYRAEGSWDIALQEMRNDKISKTYVLIGFGHNDQPGKPGRSTDLQTEFPVFMVQYIKEVKDAGATPVLFTPLTRRIFEDGILLNDLEGHAGALRKIARDENIALVDMHALSRKALQEMGVKKSLYLAQIPPSSAQIKAAKKGTSIKPAITDRAPEGEIRRCNNAAIKQACADFTPQTYATGKVNLAFDFTHLGEEGAAYFSAMFAEELARQVPELAGSIIP